VFDAGILGNVYRRSSLLTLIGPLFPRIGDEKRPMCPFKCRFKGFRPIQIRQGDFVCEFAMLARIAAQSTYLESAAGLQCTHNSASLLPRCADYGDQFLIVG